MPPHSSTSPLSPSSDQDHTPTTATHPKPPGHLFRVVRPLSFTPSSSIYLCLPRSPPTPTAKSESLLASLQHLGCSALLSKHVTLLPHLVVVRIKRDEAELRRDYEILDDKGLVLRGQFTGDVGSSWVCERVVFGVSLKEFGEMMCAQEGSQGGVAGWMVAHILLRIIQQVGDDGRGGVTAQDVRLDMYGDGSEDVWRYRGYPSVVLCDMATSGNTARSVLELMFETIAQWSDCAADIKRAVAVGQQEIITDDPIMLVLRDVQRLLQHKELGMFHVQRDFVNRLVDIRHTGPVQMPRGMVENLHADLVSDGQMAHALREPTVIPFDDEVDAFRRIVNGDVPMSVGGLVGMKTKYILVMRFRARRDVFLKQVEKVEGVTMDKDTEMEVDEGSSLDGEFDWEEEMTG